VTTYRVVRRQYADLSGYGARLYGGRFNPPGIPAVYTSESIALALLEILVHIDKSEMPDDYVVMVVRFSGRRIYRRPGTHLTNVRQFTNVHFRDTFYRWPVLRVTSVIVPQEYNFVLLPEASHFHATVESVESHGFDQRLFTVVPTQSRHEPL
jgi:RES domain-containing protein